MTRLVRLLVLRLRQLLRVLALCFSGGLVAKLALCCSGGLVAKLALLENQLIVGESTRLLFVGESTDCRRFNHRGQRENTLPSTNFANFAF